MSFIHSTIVGHFAPETLTQQLRNTTRLLDINEAKLLLAEFPDHVSEQVEFRDGYAECWWASPRFNQAVYDYAYRLAEMQDCVAAETPLCVITYPELAKQRQSEASQHWREKNPPKEHKPLPPPLFNPAKPGPCPYCGEPLRTSKARQCRFCKMDWHDAQNIHRRTQKRENE